MPAVGAAAPDFTLASTSGQNVTLSALKGKNVLLAFFPLAFTGTCTKEMCEITNDYSKFESLNAVVLPISVDSVPTLKEFKAKEKLGVDLLSDFKREVSRAYGTLMDQTFFSNRAYVVIDKAGTVRWTFAEETPGTKRDSSELLAQLKAIA
jgi:peroxiredoxin